LVDMPQYRVRCPILEAQCDSDSGGILSRAASGLVDALRGPTIAEHGCRACA
jgi:hypothetical protein